MHVDNPTKLPPNLLSLQLECTSRVTTRLSNCLTRLEVPHSVLSENVESLPPSLTYIRMCINLSFSTSTGLKVLLRGLITLALEPMCDYPTTAGLVQDPFLRSLFGLGFAALRQTLEDNVSAVEGGCIGALWVQHVQEFALKEPEIGIAAVITSNTPPTSLHSPDIGRAPVRSFQSDVAVEHLEYEWQRDVLKQVPKRIAELRIIARQRVTFKLPKQDLLDLPTNALRLAIANADVNWIQTMRETNRVFGNL